MNSDLQSKAILSGNSCDGGGATGEGKGGSSVNGDLQTNTSTGMGLETPSSRDSTPHPSVHPAGTASVEHSGTQLLRDGISNTGLNQQQSHQQNQQFGPKQSPSTPDFSCPGVVPTNGTTEPHRTSLHESISLPPSSNIDTVLTKSNAGGSASTRKHLDGKQLRRKNRRRLHRLLKNPQVVPSFLKVIEGRKKIKTEPNTNGTGTNTTRNDKNNTVVDLDGDLDDDNDDDFLLEPPVVVIDVDQYIGLKRKRKFPEAILSAPLPVGSSTESVVPTIVRSYGITPVVTGSSSVPAVMRQKTIEHKNPADEGWFEGTYPLSIMPDDEIHLSEIQKFVRKNMEYFSATNSDCTATSGRRKPTVRGQVGIRCIHCARALQASHGRFRNGERPRMPSGSVSYPVNFAALYNLSIQKPQHHFENCPNLPPDMRWNSPLSASKANKTGETSSGPRKRMKRGITAVAYWNISCRRLGLVELDGNAGLRFGRNLKLDLLPFDTVRAKLEQEQPQLFPRQNQTSPVVRVTANLAPNRVVSMGSTVATPINLPKDVLDILQDAKGREGDETNSLVFEEDNALLSDFMFLTVKQVSLCHAIKEDFATRGKKTKLMRIGFAGFCCRHCKLNYQSNRPSAFQNSCRSFSSSRDNVASAVSNSFALHLMKCLFVPQQIKRALQTLKKVHAKQMQQMPYGNQSRFFAKFWDRIRAADKPKADDPIADKTVKREDNEEYIPEVIRSTPAKNQQGRSSNRLSLAQNSTSGSQSVSVVDEEARQILIDAQKSWEPSENDNLILPEDRNLVSDFVFLCMRQLKVAIPTAADLRGNRRSATVTQIAGLCCIHCSSTQTDHRTMQSGRSFPSAPDNIAGTLNSSLYKHMLICPNVPASLKRTINAVRTIHSQQCSSLPFGSQRRFFRKLFARLKDVPLDDAMGGDLEHPEKDFGSKLRECTFVQTNTPLNTYWQCARCRMVPFDYRAPGSLFFSQPSVAALKKHCKECNKECIYWDHITLSMKALDKKYGIATPLVNLESFFQMVCSVVGNETNVIRTFMIKLGKQGQLPEESSNKYIWRELPTEVDFNEVQDKFSDLQKDLGLALGSLTDFPDFLNFLQLLSCNFQVPVASSTAEKKNLITVDQHQEELSTVQPTSDDIHTGRKWPTKFDERNHSKSEFDAKERLGEQISDGNTREKINAKPDDFLEFKSSTKESSEEAEHAVQPTKEGDQRGAITNETVDLSVSHPKLSIDHGMESNEAGQFDDA